MDIQLHIYFNNEDRRRIYRFTKRIPLLKAYWKHHSTFFWCNVHQEIYNKKMGYSKTVRHLPDYYISLKVVCVRLYDLQHAMKYALRRYLRRARSMHVAMPNNAWVYPYLRLF